MYPRVRRALGAARALSAASRVAQLCRERYRAGARYAQATRGSGPARRGRPQRAAHTTSRRRTRSACLVGCTAGSASMSKTGHSKLYVCEGLQRRGHRETARRGGARCRAAIRTSRCSVRARGSTKRVARTHRTRLNRLQLMTCGSRFGGSVLYANSRRRVSNQIKHQEIRANDKECTCSDNHVCHG